MSQSLAAVKILAPIFIFSTYFDNYSMMISTSQKSESEHPLLADRVRLDRILDVMYAIIQKTLFPWHPGQRRPRVETSQTNNASSIERILEETGVSADDVLNKAFLALLEYPLERLEGTFEGLAVRIAQNKAVDALRASRKGLRGTDLRPQLHLVSGDAERAGPAGDREPPLFEVLPSNSNPEAEYFLVQGVLNLRDLAREVLSDRDREVFFAIHFDGYTRTEVGKRLGLTSQRIGQIYNTAMQQLETHPKHPFKFEN